MRAYDETIIRRDERSRSEFDGRGRGHRADARNLLELLLLGAGPGEVLTLLCVGDDASAAYEAIAAVLGPPSDAIAKQGATPGQVRS